MDSRTPGYMVREEMQREKMRCKAGRRAWGFEKRLEEGRREELAIECMRELRRRAENGGKLSVWERERNEFSGVRGVGVREVESDEREQGEMWVKIERKGRDLQIAERWEKIRESRYNIWYGRVTGEGIPSYLKKGWGESRLRRVARFRLDNEMGEGRYWEGETKRTCRLCGSEEKTWEHVWERCRAWREGGEVS